MHITPMSLRGLYLIEPTVHGDARGFFMEVFNQHVFAGAGIDLTVVQHNHSRSQKNVVRGLHFQWDKPLGKLMRVVRGRAFVVAVDIKKSSETRGKWEGKECSDATKELIWAPCGFATGFCALVDDTEIEYYYSALYNPQGESNIIWNDSDIAIRWPVKNPVLSSRDANAESFAAWLKRPESDRMV